MNLIEVLNTIRDNATADYQERIPEATRENMSDLRFAMTAEENITVANEFMATLMNKLVKSVVHSKRFDNPLKCLKRGKKPLGDTVEEIYNNFLKGEAYDPTGASLMKRTLPDTKTVYHRRNYKMKYPVTVNRDELQKAFASYDALESYITGIIDSLYNSAELDEYKNTMSMIEQAASLGAIKNIEIADPLTGEENAKEFIKTVKTISRLMTFPSTQYNGYLDAQGYDEKPITTFSRKNEQVLIIDAATETTVNIDVLASTFNMSVAEFNDTRKIVIDVFPDPRMRAVLVDEAFFQIYDDLYTIGQFYNPDGLYTNYWLHVQQTFAYSILVNAVAFVIPDPGE